MPLRYQYAAAVVAVVALFARPLPAQESKIGEAAFRLCAPCHALEAGKQKAGPSLHGLFGRRAGSVEGFAYSDAMRQSGLIWNEESLAAYLRAPRKVIPGARMAFAGIEDRDRLMKLIAYLKLATQ